MNFRNGYLLILAMYLAKPSPIEKQDGIMRKAACDSKSAEIHLPITNKLSSTIKDSIGN